MSTPVLYFFPVQARAELIRFVLAFGGIEYKEENSIMTTYKADSPFGFAPYMDIEGKRYGQSIALAEYYAKKAGLLGNNDLEDLEILSYADYIILDCAEPAIKAHMSKYFSKDVSNEQLDEIKNENLQKYIKTAELLEKLSKSDYLLGDKITFADIALAYAYNFGEAILPPDFKSSLSPKINAIVDRVCNHHGLKEYINKRNIPNIPPRPT